MRCRISGAPLGAHKAQTIGAILPEGADPTGPMDVVTLAAVRCYGCNYREVWRSDRPAPAVYSKHEEKN